MDRRNALGLFSIAAAGSTLVPAAALGQSACTPPCYPQIAAEQGMTLAEEALMYPPGNLQRYRNGESDWTAALQRLRTVAAAGIACHIPAGTYSYSTSPNWAISGLQITGERGAILQHTGIGVAFNIDAGANGVHVNGLALSNLIIRGNANTTDGLFSQGVTHSTFRFIEVRDCSQKAFHIKFGVMNHYDTCVISGGIVPLTVHPQAGFYLDSSGPGYYTAACTFTNCIAETFDGKGCALVDASGTLFNGGSFESTSIGLDIIYANCRRNRFVNVWFEDNAVNDLRVQAGVQNSFSNCYFGSPSSSPTVQISAAAATTFECGYIRTVEVQSYSRNTVFIATTFDEHPALGIVGSGSYQLLGGTKADNGFNITTTMPNVL